MKAYTIEKLLRGGWKRDSKLYWSSQEVQLERERLLKSNQALDVRVLPVTVGEQAVAESKA